MTMDPTSDRNGKNRENQNRLNETPLPLPHCVFTNIKLC